MLPGTTSQTLVQLDLLCFNLKSIAKALPLHMVPTFILVHGTFARRAPWTREGSPLVAALARAFPGACFLDFEWSGGNSHAARGKGAEALRELIVAQPTDSRLTIIAHSHGGNVALQALCDESLQRRIRGLITLATPFIHTRQRDLDQFFRPVSLIVPSMAMLVGVPLLAVIGVIIVNLIAFGLGLSEGWAMAGIILWSILMLGWVTQGFRKLRKRTLDQQASAARRQAELQAALSPVHIATPVVAAYVGRDEAAFVLRTGYLAGDLPHRIWPGVALILKCAAWAAGLGLLLGAPLEAITGYGTFKMVSFDLAMLLIDSLIGGAFLWVLLMIAAPYLIRGLIVFGGEGPFDNLILSIFSSKAPPPSVDRAHGLPVRLGLGLRLRHSAIYAHPGFLAKLPDLVRSIDDPAALARLGAVVPRHKPSGRPLLAPACGLLLVLGFAGARAERYLIDLAAAAKPANWRERYPELRGELVEERPLISATTLPAEGLTRVVLSLDLHCALTGRLTSDEEMAIEVHSLRFESNRTLRGPELIENRIRRQHSPDVWLKPGFYHLHLRTDRGATAISSTLTHACWNRGPDRLWSWRDWFRF